jgi:hypothetical protein
VSPSQAEEIRATKKPRFEEPFSETTDEAATNISSRDTAVSLPTAADSVDEDPVKGTLVTAQWTPEEDAKLNSAVTKTCKKKYGKKYIMDWVEITALVPGRTRKQCMSRWHNPLDQSISRATGRSGQWTAVEESKLKDTVQMHGSKNWAAIVALVPGRKHFQCSARWHDVLDPNINREKRRTGKWLEDEDIKLKDAVQTHGGKNWVAIAALVPGRTHFQCRSRWKDTLDPSIDRANRRYAWAEDEDSKLKEAVKTYGGKNWVAIAALVPGRTKRQCYDRWNDILEPNIDGASGRKGS